MWRRLWKSSEKEFHTHEVFEGVSPSRGKLLVMLLGLPWYFTDIKDFVLLNKYLYRYQFRLVASFYSKQNDDTSHNSYQQFLIICSLVTNND